jgi:hypothetical protein
VASQIILEKMTMTEKLEMSQGAKHPYEMPCYIELIDKLEEYIAFLEKGAMNDAIHCGYSVSESVFQEGERLRAEIRKLKEAI